MENRIEFVQALKRKRVKVREIPKWGTYLRKQWEDEFVSHLTVQEKEDIYLYSSHWASGYLWHVFSYEKRNFLQLEEADKAFKQEKKKFCYVFFQHYDDAYILENAETIIADDFKVEEDVYVVDKDFNWTYVRTHDSGYLGPYFSRK